ncbi:MAG: RsmF rRNA methyltransferase first C-terminal domain-containing protein [Clostridium sp.]
MPALDRLRVLRPGLHLGEFKTKRLNRPMRFLIF